jgi:hypothetical protein
MACPRGWQLFIHGKVTRKAILSHCVISCPKTETKLLIDRISSNSNVFDDSQTLWNIQAGLKKVPTIFQLMGISGNLLTCSLL